MKRRVAVLLVALDARAHAASTTNETHELPASAIDVLDADDGLEEYGVGEMHLGYPDGAHDMHPLAAIGLLVRARLVIRTQYALNGRRWRLYAATTQPLALGYVRHAVAFLVHCQVAHVAEQYHVRVETLAVETYAAECVLVYK